MGGLIAGFLGGASKGFADAGKMLLTSQLDEEREEARFLRDKTLRQNIASEDRDFRTSERVAGEETAATVAATKAGTDKAAATAKAKSDLERTKYTADNKAGKGGDTTNIKDARSLRAAGYPNAIADAVAHGALKQIKDEETGDMVLINALDNKPVGRLTTIDGKKQWLPEGEQTPNAKVNKSHRDKAKINTNKKAGLWTSDKTDFPSTGGDREEWKKKDAQRLANEEREAKNTKGVVDGQIAKPVSPSSPGHSGETKLVGAKKQKMTKEQFMDAMTKKHGMDKMDQILNMWEKL